MKPKPFACVTGSAAQTKKLGALLADLISGSRPCRQAQIILLRGSLGAGKTRFTQGFARRLGVKGQINSPTFVILKKYPLAGPGRFRNFYHIDCYRLSGARDLENIGAQKIFNDPANIIIVEWPETAGLPETAGWAVNFEVVAKNRRRIKIIPKTNG